MLSTEWKTATKSNPSGNCVECRYEKATKSAAAGHCVEVTKNALHNSRVFVRDSKQNNYPESNRIVLSYAQAEWTHYLTTLKLGYGAVYDGDMFVMVRGTKMLTFTLAEWEAFMDGVWKGEFDVPATDVEPIAVSV